jgi:hypothetical protein
VIRYELKLDYPKNYPTCAVDGSFDLNDPVQVHRLLLELIPTIQRDKPDLSTDSIGEVLEGLLEEDIESPWLLAGDHEPFRSFVARYLVQEFDRAHATYAKLRQGLSTMRYSRALLTMLGDALSFHSSWVRGVPSRT